MQRLYLEVRGDVRVDVVEKRGKNGDDNESETRRRCIAVQPSNRFGHVFEASHAVLIKVRDVEPTKLLLS